MYYIYYILVNHAIQLYGRKVNFKYTIDLTIYIIRNFFDYFVSHKFSVSSGSRVLFAAIKLLSQPLSVNVYGLIKSLAVCTLNVASCHVGIKKTCIDVKSSTNLTFNKLLISNLVFQVNFQAMVKI